MTTRSGGEYPRRLGCAVATVLATWGGSLACSNKGAHSGSRTPPSVDGGSPGADAPCLDFAEPTAVGEAHAAALVGLSGLVASREHPGVLYAHGDGSDSGQFFALDTSGATLGDFSLAGALTDDWEDIAVGSESDGSSWLYLADIGDNIARGGAAAGRAAISVFRVPEPSVVPSQAPVAEVLTNWETLWFTYPDVPYDAETLMVDPLTDTLVFVTRETDGAATVFQAPTSTPPDTPTTLEQIATIEIGPAFGSYATAGDIAPSGDRVILRTYTAVLLWARAPGSTLEATFAAAPVSVPAPKETQSEGITFSADGNAWFSSGEQRPVIFESLSACE